MSGWAPAAEVHTLLGRKTLKPLYEKSDLYGFYAFLVNYGLMALCFWAAWWSPWLILPAMVVLGGRQLGIAILMHDCAHESLFRSRRLNRFFGAWVFGAPVLADLDGYRRYHMVHHRATGTDEDPDRPNYEPYPVGSESFRRKVIRDLTGRTGVKILYLLLLANLGLVKYQLSYRKEDAPLRPSLGEMLQNGVKNLHKPVIVHVLLVLVLPSLWLYGLWWASFMTTQMLFSRIRNAAEHAAVPDVKGLHPLQNTRTTHARWWERLTVAPSLVNYHLEHHLIPGIPPQHLPTLHRILMERGYLNGADVCEGYGEVLAKLQSKVTA